LYSGDVGRTSSGSIFVGGFVLGSLIVGALGCVYAPKVSMFAEPAFSIFVTGQ